MALRNPLAGRPLFIRIFALMLVGVLLTQGLNLVVLLVVPMPPPNQHALTAVADSLRSGEAAPGLDLTTGHAPPDAGPPERLARHRQWLMQALGVGEDDIRLELRGPGDHDEWGPGGMDGFPGLQRGGPPPRPPEGRPPPDGTFGDRPPPRPDENGGWREPPGGAGGPEIRDDLINGDFAAALRLPDGQWRVVQPAGGGLRGWYQRMVFWLLAALAVVAPMAWWLSRRLAGPIALFARAAERLGRDPGAPALEVTGPPEVAAAAVAFNQMQDRLRRYVEDRTLMVAAIAHDLRTPLARLAFRLEEAPETVRAAAADDIAEMREMITAALSFVRDMSRTAPHLPVDLAALVSRQVKASRQMGEPVTLGRLDAADISGDAAGLARLIDNVIGNAVTYGGAAQVSLTVDGTQVVILVEDEGPGIPPALLERVFDPFFRVEPSRNRHTGGTGLGLASARAVARQHGGDIILRNRPGGGLTARITLPLS